MLSIGQNTATHQTTMTTPGWPVRFAGLAVFDRDSALCQRIAPFETSTLTCRS